MAHRFPSEEWTDAYAEWTHGKVAMVIQADPDMGIDEDTAMILDVDRGRCHGTAYVKGMDQVEAADPPFVIVAPYERWKQVIGGEIDPIKGMMQGKLKLTKGHLPTMLRFVESSRQLVVSASSVPTEFAG